MAKLLARITFLTFGFRLIRITVLLIILFLTDMFSEKTARCILLCLTATPPHSATPFRPMNAARPIVVFVLCILFVATLTGFFVQIDVFTVSQFCNLAVQILYLHFKMLNLPVLLSVIFFKLGNLSV
jgi:hypothetical protein